MKGLATVLRRNIVDGDRPDQLYRHLLNERINSAPSSAHYGSSPRVTRLLDNTEVQLLPSANPDGFSASLEGCHQHLGSAWFRDGVLL